MSYPQRTRRQLVWLTGLIVILFGTLWFVHNQGSRQSTPGNTPFADSQSGLSASLPSAYQPYSSNGAPSTGLIRNYLRTKPSAYLTFRHDDGLGSVTRLLRRGTLEHIESEIANFFPTKYGSSYKSLETKHVQVAGRESIQHEFTYTSSSHEDLHVRLLAIPYSDDVAYYVILQVALADFDQVARDLDVIKASLQLTGPQPSAQTN